MKAAVLTEYNEPLVVEEITLGKLGPRSVHLKVDASGVCHSDLSAFDGKVPMGTPLILGHEGTGTVLAVGSDVQRLKPGDQVIPPVGSASSASTTSRSSATRWAPPSAASRAPVPTAPRSAP
jgi:Zn-dependent alcohol dehydrogenase